jgi:hypothetical protein
MPILVVGFLVGLFGSIAFALNILLRVINEMLDEDPFIP